MTPERTESQRRKRRSRIVLVADLSAVPESAGLWGSDDEAADSLCERVRGALIEALTPKQREAVELYFFEGLSQCEIAGRLGLSQQVVHKRLFGDVREGKPVGGALRRLRERLEGALTPAAEPARV